MKTVHLQYFGSAAAKKAEDFKTGEKMMWNHGAKSIVRGVISETAKFVTYKIEHDGVMYERRLKKDRLVAIG